MPRPKPDPTNRPPTDPRELPVDVATSLLMSGRSYFSSSALADDIREWDIKGDWTIAAILGVVNSGDTIMLSMTKSRDAVNVAISSRPKEWQRTFVRDADQWDELMISIARKCAPVQEPEPTEG